MVFAAADVGAEAVAVGNPHACLRGCVGWKGEAAKTGIDGHGVGPGAIAPVAEVRRDDLGCGNGRAGGADPDREALAIAIVDRRAEGGGLPGLDGLGGFESAAANGPTTGRAAKRRASFPRTLNR